MMLLLFIIFGPGGRLRCTALALMMSPCEAHFCVFRDDKKEAMQVVKHLYSLFLVSFFLSFWFQGTSH